MQIKKDLSKRIQQLLDKSSAILATKEHSGYSKRNINYNPLDAVSATKKDGTVGYYAEFKGLRASVLSFIANVYGNKHSYYSEFNKFVVSDSDAEAGHAILQAIQDEIEGGWIFSVKQLITAAESLYP